MAKLLLALSLTLAATPAVAGDASSMEQISARGPVAAMSQLDRALLEAPAQRSTPEFAGRAEVRGIGAPTLIANTLERLQTGTGMTLDAAQSGSGQFARIVQSGQDHLARLVQTGSGHRAEISQTGQGHWASLSQAGESNTAGVVQTGAFASALVSQTGGFNTVSIRQ